MSAVHTLTKSQMAVISKWFPSSHGGPGGMAEVGESEFGETMVAKLYLYHEPCTHNARHFARLVGFKVQFYLPLN